MGISDILEKDHEIEAGRLTAIIQAMNGGEFLRDSFEEFQRNLRHHIYIEEQIVFPHLLGSDSDLKGPLAGLEMEHASLWMLMNRIISEAEKGLIVKTPKYLDEIMRILTVHNNLESSNIYPRIGNDLKLVISGIEMPDGWICRKLRRKP